MKNYGYPENKTNNCCINPYATIPEQADDGNAEQDSDKCEHNAGKCAKPPFNKADNQGDVVHRNITVFRMTDWNDFIEGHLPARL